MEDGSSGRRRVTECLDALRGGDDRASDDLVAVVYEELRSIARHRMGRERRRTELQTTALVHEAYLRLVDGDFAWNSRAHFFSAAAEAMRRILVDRARSRGREKRGGGEEALPLDESRVGHEPRSEELLALDRALERLAHHDPRRARVVLLRYFAGLTIEEIARCLDTSERSVSRLWTGARAWLHREMTSAPPSDSRP